jgi:putative ABC transport system permease protein
MLVARRLTTAVSTDLGVLFLVLAGVCLVIGAVGIANTTMVAVLERVAEISLRRVLRARPRHIASQFLIEAAATGTAGGLAGASLACSSSSLSPSSSNGHPSSPPGPSPPHPYSA